MLDSGEFGGPQGAFSGGPLGGLLDDRDLTKDPISLMAINQAAEDAVNQLVDKFGNPISRLIGFGVNTAMANMNPVLAVINAVGTGKNLLDAVIDKSPLTGNPDLDLTNPNKFVDDPGVFSGQTQSLGYGYGDIAGFDPQGGPFKSLGTMLGEAAVGAIKEALPNTQFGIDPDAVPLGSVSSNMGMGGGPDAANMSLDDFGIADPLGLDNALSFNNRVSPKVLNIEPSAQDMMDWNPGLFTPDLEFRTFDKFDPKTLKENFFNNPQKMFDDIEESFNMSNVQFDPDDMSMAIASTGGFESAFGPEFLGISPEVNFDTKAISKEGGEALQEALAQRAVENILSQQAPTEMINVTPPAPPKVAPQRRAAPKPSPIQVAAKAITRPEAVKKLPKSVQKSLRQGKVPTGLNSRNQDLVDRVLATPKVDIMSAGVNVKGNRALQKARSRAAQDAK
tara:strand:- start:785 stop:2134 length:1350 start_codon:yes stop_codon:yes gene_type:complete